MRGVVVRNKRFIYHLFMIMVLLAFYWGFGINVNAQGNIIEIEKSSNEDFEERDDYYDFKKFEHREYDRLDKPDELHTFHTIKKSGVGYDCVALGTKEAVVYGVDNFGKNSLEIPETIHDAVSGIDRTIVGVISLGEKQEADEKYKGEGSIYNYVDVLSDEVTGCFNYFSGGGMCKENLEELVLPKTIKFIGHCAFWEYTGLKKVTFKSNSDLILERQAFRYCTSLSTVDFSQVKGNITFEARCFMRCTSLTSFDFPDNSTISDYALQGCCNMKRVTNAPPCLILDDWSLSEEFEPQLEYVSFGNGPTEIRGVSFARELSNDPIYSLKEIELPQTAKSVYGFGRTGLTEVTLPASVRSIGSFNECKELKSINLDNITSIGSYTFLNCESLASIGKWPKGLTSLGYEAFYGCKNLHIAVYDPCDGYLPNGYSEAFDYSGITSITFSKNIADLSNYGFRGLKDLKEIKIEGGMSNDKQFMTRDGILYRRSSVSDDKTAVWELCKYPAKKSNGNKFVIPNDVCGLRQFAFEYCYFSELHIPATVWEFQEFETNKDGSNLGEYKNGGTYYSYGPFAFKDEKTKIYLTKNSYADNKFNERKTNISEVIHWLSDVTYTHVTVAYPTYYYDNGSMVSITYKLDGGTNPKANKNSITGGTSMNLAIPTKKGYIFTGWDYEDSEVLDSDDLKKNVLTPCYKGLYKGITLIAIWKIDTTIGHTTYVDNNQYKIGKKNTVTYTGGKKNAKTVTIPDTVKLNDKVYKVTAIGANAFKNNTKLKKVVVGKNVKTIGKNAFAGCKKLSTVTFKGKAITSIGANAFKNCKALKKIVITQNVKTIGKNAFSGCSKLGTVTIKSTKLKTIGSKAFKTTKKGAKFVCPKKKLKAYKAKLTKSGLPKKAKITK